MSIEVMRVWYSVDRPLEQFVREHDLGILGIAWDLEEDVYEILARGYGREVTAEAIFPGGPERLLEVLDGETTKQTNWRVRQVARLLARMGCFVDGTKAPELPSCRLPLEKYKTTGEFGTHTPDSFWRANKWRKGHRFDISLERAVDLILDDARKWPKEGRMGVVWNDILLAAIRRGGLPPV